MPRVTLHVERNIPGMFGFGISYAPREELVIAFLFWQLVLNVRPVKKGVQ